MPASPETIKLLGGRLCLDFANTVDREADDSPVAGTDALVEDDAVERWGRRLGVLSAAGAAAAAPELEPARGLRDALYALFAALARGEDAPPASLARLGDEFGAAAAAAHLARRGDGFALDWPAGEPRRVRYAVAADAFALLNEPALLARVSRCPG